MPVKLVEANYTIRDTMKFSSEQAVLSVYSNGTSEMTMQFTYLTQWNYTPPDGAFLRLTKVDGVEGNYGQAPIVIVSKGKGKDTKLSATIPFDRAFGKAEFITFSFCRSDGKELFPMKFRLKSFDSADGKWPKPDSTPPVPTIPPVKPTPTPTPRPTLVPGATEPPQDTALYAITFRPGGHPEKYTPDRCILRVYEEMSVMTIDFAYKEALPEGTHLFLEIVDSLNSHFGEGAIVANGDGTYTAAIFFNQQVGYMKHLSLRARVYGQRETLFTVQYYLNHNNTHPDGWEELEPIATVRPTATPSPTPLPENATATPAPTIPPQSQYWNTTTYSLLDQVKRFSLSSAQLTRYRNGLDVLKIEFRYSGELPANARFMISHREYLEGNFGEALIEKGDGDLLTATIITDQLQGSLRAFRLKCMDSEGNEQFYADFGPGYNMYWSGGVDNQIARSLLPTATPEPSETPVPTPTVAATADPSVSPTPAPTEPPYAQARSKRRFQILDKPAGYSNYNTTLRRYEDFDVLTVYFRYSKDLPEGAKLRLIQVDSVLNNYGEALILPSELETAPSDLLCAKIPSDRIPLNCTALRLQAISGEGETLFQVDYFPDERGYDPDDARLLLDGAKPAPDSPPEGTTPGTGSATPPPDDIQVGALPPIVLPPVSSGGETDDSYSITIPGFPFGS